MIDAIGIVLLLGFLAACIAVVIGVVIGVRQKQWTVTWISGVAAGVLLVLLMIAAGISASSSHDTDPDEQARAPQEAAPLAAVQPTAVPTPTVAPTPIPPTPVPPTPTPQPFGLDVTRDEAQKRFERMYRDHGLVFEPDTFKGLPALAGSAFDGRIVLVLVGNGDSPLVYGALVLHDTGTVIPEVALLAAESMWLLSELAVPKWDRAKWLPEAMNALPDPNKNPSAFINSVSISETDMHGDVQIKLTNTLRDGMASTIYSIGPEDE